MALSPSQRGVAAGAATAAAVTVAVAAGVVLLIHPEALADALARRLHLLAVSALAPALALAVAIGRLAQQRFHTPEDIDGSGLTAGTARAKLLQALLQNTLEQAVLALPVYLFWTLWAPLSLVALAPAAAVLFLAGRLLFFAGYARGAAGRALGFGLTFYPTVALLAAGVVLAAVTVFQR